MAALFGLGLGWSFSYVAANAGLSDSTAAHERGKLVGFNDLVADVTGASLALLAGLALTALGVVALAIGGAEARGDAGAVDPAQRAGADRCRGRGWPGRLTYDPAPLARRRRPCDDPPRACERAATDRAARWRPSPPSRSC